MNKNKDYKILNNVGVIHLRNHGYYYQQFATDNIDFSRLIKFVLLWEAVDFNERYEKTRLHFDNTNNSPEFEKYLAQPFDYEGKDICLLKDPTYIIELDSECYHLPLEELLEKHKKRVVNE